MKKPNTLEITGNAFTVSFDKEIVTIENIRDEKLPMHHLTLDGFIEALESFLKRQ